MLIMIHLGQLDAVKMVYINGDLRLLDVDDNNARIFGDDGGEVFDESISFT